MYEHSPALHSLPDGLTLSRRELDLRIRAAAARLSSIGLKRGDRVVVLIRPGVDFIVAVHGALFVGVVPVLIDPGVGCAAFLRAIERAQPRAVIAEPFMRVLCWLWPRTFGEALFISSKSLQRLGTEPATIDDACVSPPDSPAMILFTTGSTGAPKAVVVTHRALAAQLAAMTALAGLERGSVFIALVPALALLGPRLECCIVLPDLDFGAPSKACPAELTRVIREYGVTHGFAAPTLWSLIATHCADTQVRLDTLQHVIIGGAPTPPKLVHALRSVMRGDARMTLAYGATEAIPLASIPAKAGIGTTAPLGYEVPGVEIRVIEASDQPLANMAHARILAAGEVGEIVVRGAVVSAEYHAFAEANLLAKIPDQGGPWHRMGDLGYRDHEGSLHFVGRKSERVVTEHGVLDTAEIEAHFMEHPEVRRAALIGVGCKPHQSGVLVVESATWNRWRLRRELLELGQIHPRARHVTDVIFCRSLPLDKRHNAKVLRTDLALRLAPRFV